MPKNFTECVNGGGKIRTKVLKNNKYIHICYDKDGNSFSGEVRTRKKKKSKARRDTRKLIKQGRNLLPEIRRLQNLWHEKYHDE